MRKVEFSVSIFIATALTFDRSPRPGKGVLSLRAGFGAAIQDVQHEALDIWLWIVASLRFSQ